MEKINTRLFSNRQLISLIIPLAVEQGLAILVGMFDSVMVSSVGEAAISGVSLVDMINSIALALFAALATGGAVVVSQFIGAKDTMEARKSACQLVTLSGILGLGLMALCLLFDKGLMRLFFGSIEPAVMDAGLVYLRITVISFPFIALYNAGAAVFRCMGNSKISMKISFLMNIINVGGNALCIFVLKMGVAGVAIPTLISRAVAAIVILVLLSYRNQALYLEGKYVFHIQRNIMKKILRISIPSACENSFFQLGRTILTSMIALFGTVHITASTVANCIDALAVICVSGANLATVTVIGQCVGVGDMEQIEYYIKKLILWTYALFIVNSLPILIFCRPLIGLYNNLSQETVDLAFWLIWIHNGLGMLVWPLSFVIPNILRSACDVKFTMYVGVASMLLVRIGCAWVLCVALGWGVTGVWVAMVLDWITRGTFFVSRLRSGKWKRLFSHY